MIRTKSVEMNDEEKQSPGFPGIGIPAAVLCNEELTLLEKLLFGLIRNLAASEHGCFASNRFLGRYLSVHPQTISNGIAKLLKLQYITAKYRMRADGMQVRTVRINPNYEKIYEELTIEYYKKINSPIYEKTCGRMTSDIHPYEKSLNKSVNEYVNEDVNISLSPLEKNTPVKDNPKHPLYQFYQEAAYLSKIIQSSKNIRPHNPATLNSWAKEIKSLSKTSGIALTRIHAALEWYEDNIGCAYVPVIECGKSLKEKFLKLEAAIDRGKQVRSAGKKKFDYSAESYSNPENKTTFSRGTRIVT